MNNKKIYIILFAILYLCVALVSTIHAISFFGLANAAPLAIILAIAFEVGQAAVLFSILTDSSQQKRVMPWVLMSILTLVQVLGNVYNSYRYLILNSEDGLRFFKEPIFVWTQIPDNVANVILSYIIGAILPIVSLLMTAMVTGFLNKKEEIKVEEVKDEPKEEPKEEQKEEQPKININEETGEITPPAFGPHEYVIPSKEEDKIKKEYITPEAKVIKGTDEDEGVIGNKGEDGLKKLEELKEEIPVEEKIEEPSAEFAHEIINEEDKKPAHFINI